ncbi:hypothetical protein [Micromonospora sp. NPDC004704]
MRHKLAAPAGLATGVLVFVGVLLATRSVLWPALLAVAGAIGVYLMVDDRSPAEAAGDSYLDEANAKVGEALRTLRDVRRLSREVQAPAARASLETACRHVPDLFDRVRGTSPNTLYSTASQIGAHLVSLDGAVRRYLDIQGSPLLYRDADALLTSGDQAFQRFADFTLESVRLVNQGDIGQYVANLDTVAPPRMPEVT